MFRKISSLINPIEILLIVVSYFLGSAMSHYLGYSQKSLGLWNGLIIILSFTLGCRFLGDYFQKTSYLSSPDLLIGNEKKKDDKVIRNTRLISLLIGIAFLAVGIIPFFSLFLNHYFNRVNVIILALGFFVVCLIDFLTNLVSRWGMMEFFKSILYANIVPALAFTIQINTFHRIVFLLTFPLFFIFFALFIVRSLPSNHENQTESGQSLISRIGPITILRIHNFSLLLGYLLLLSGTFFDLPWRLIWPVLITFPIGLIQFWQVNQILLGRKLNLTVLEVTAIATTIFSVYLMMLNLWLN
jgi:hypothetical protein